MSSILTPSPTLNSGSRTQNNPDLRRKEMSKISIDIVFMDKIEVMPSFLTKFWLFSSKSSVKSENGYLGFVMILTESVEFY